MNVGYARILPRIFAVVLFLFAAGCSQAIPEVSVLSNAMSGPKIEGQTSLRVSYDGASTVILNGTCSTFASAVEISTDAGLNWSTPSGASETSCSDGAFTLVMSSGDLSGMGLTGPTMTLPIWVRAEITLVPTSHAVLEMAWESAQGPSVAITPTSAANATTLTAAIMVSPAAPGNLYRYKVVRNASACAVASGYSGDIAEYTPVSHSLSSFADGGLVLCAVGSDGTTMNPYAYAATYPWVKDTVGPAVTLTTASLTPTDVFTVNIFSPDWLADFASTDIQVSGGATVTNFANVDGQNWQVTISPPAEGVYTIRMLAGAVQDLSTNLSSASNILTVNYTVPRVEFATTGGSVLEGSTGTHQYALVATRSFSQTSQATVNYEIVTGSGAAVNGLDYSLAVGTLTFAAGSTSATISIDIFGDTIYENNEAFSVELKSPSANLILGSSTIYALSLTNDEAVPTVQFAAATTNASEATTPHLMTVTLSGPLGVEARVDYSVSGGTAVGAGTDYTLASGTLTFAAGETTKDISASLVNDVISEGAETILLGISNPVAVTLGAQSAHTHTINDDEIVPTVQFAAATSNAAETVSPHLMTVTLSGALSTQATVDFAVTGGTSAGAGVDYTLSAGTLTFAAGETTKDISASIVDDAIFEGSETITFNLSSPTSVTLGSQTTHTHTINDNETQPTVQYAVATSNAPEALTPHLMNLTLTGASASQVTVNYSVTGGTATGAGTDYTLANGTLTFAAGVTSQNVSMAVLNDSIDEADETVAVTLSAPVNTTLGTTSVHTATIQDNDSAPIITFAAAAVSSNENAGAVNLVVNLSNPSATQITVDYAVTGGAAVGGGTDFTLASGTLTFAALSTTQNISLGIVDDNISELTEDVDVTLTNPVAATIGVPGIHTHSINDNELIPTINFTVAADATGEATSAKNVVVVLNRASSQSITVDYSVTGGSATGSGIDFTLASGTLTYAAGETTKNIALAIVNDALAEGDETIQVTVANPNPNATIGATSVHTHTITDDEAAPTVYFSASASNAAETVGSHTITVDLSGPDATQVTVDYSVTSTIPGAGIAIGAGTDFTLANGTLTFAPGETTKNVVLAVVDDTIGEPNEVVSLQLSNVTGGLTSQGAQGTHNFTINSNDTPAIQYALASVSVAENVGGGAHSVVVTLSNAASADVTADFAVTGGTASGSGVDYSILTASPITVTAGQTTGTIAWTIIDDGTFEGNETVGLNLTNASANSTLGSQVTHTTTINDNETQPVVQYAAATSNAGEASTPHTFAVTLSGPSSSQITVDYSVTGGTATGSGTDYTLASGTLTFAAGDVSEDISIPVVNDVLYEGNETITLNISAPSNATLGALATHTHTINDDETQPTVQYAAATSSAGEAATPHAIAVTLSGASAAQVTVDYTVTGGTAAGSGVDFTLASGTLTFAAGDISEDILIPIVNDAITESPETIDLNISNPTIVTLGAQQIHTHTINDDDTAPTVQYASSVSNAGEATTPHLVSVTLSGASALQVTVDYSVTGGSATGGGTDYTLSSGTLTFAAGDISEDISIPIVNDSIFEGDETIELNVSGPVNATLGGQTTHTHTINEDDPAPTLSFSAAAASAAEVVGSDTVYTATVNLSSASWQTVTVNYSGAVVSASGSDFAVTGGTLSFSPGQTSKTFSYTIKTDVLPEPDETFTLDLSSPTNATIVTGQQTVTIPLNDASGNNWTGLGGNNLWNNGANWTLGIPTAAHVATFNSICIGLSCNVSIPTVVSVAGIDIQSSYTGTISQGNTTVTVGSSGFVMEAGAYNAGSGTLTTQAFNLSGGTFTASSGTTNVNGNFSHSGGTWNHNGGTVIFQGNTAASISSAADFNNVSMAKSGGTPNVTLSNNLTTVGTLALSSGSVFTTGGILIAKGPATLNNCVSNSAILKLAGSTSQTLTGNAGCKIGSIEIASTGGTVTLAGNITFQNNFTYTSGIISAGTSTLEASGAGPSTVDLGSQAYKNFMVSKTANTVTTVGTSFIGGGFSIASGSAVLNGGTIDVSGNIVSYSTGGGTTLIRAVGTGAQTLTCGPCKLPNLEISKSSGSLTYMSDVILGGNYVRTSGTILDSAFSTKFSGNANSTIDVSGHTFNHLTIEKTSGAGLNIINLIAQGVSCSGSTSNMILSGTLEVRGSYSGTSTCGGGAGEILFSGSTNETASGGGGSITLPNTRIDKSAGTFSINSPLNIVASGGDIRLLTGKVIQAAAVSIADELRIESGTTWVRQCNSLTYVTLSNSGTLITGKEGTISITDATVTEGTSAGLTVSLSPPNCQDTVVSWSTSDGTARVAQSDYSTQSNASFTIPISGTATINVANTNDAIYDPAEYFTVALAGLPPGITAGDLVGQITLNESGPVPVISIGAVTPVGEPASGSTSVSVNISIDRASQTATTFTYKTNDGIAVAGTDYTALGPSPATIPAGTSTIIKGVNILSDNYYEGAENFDFEIGTITGADAGVTSRTITIADYQSPPEISITALTGNSIEDATTEPSVSLALSGAAERTLTISYSVADGTASRGSDYQVNAGANTLTIGGGITSATIPIQTLTYASALVEPDETFSVTLNTGGAGWIRHATDFTYNHTIYDKDIGSFSISGVSSPNDDNIDGFLEGSPEADVTWQKALYATSYDFEIKEGVTTVCSETGIPADASATKTFSAIYMSSPSNRVGCLLKLNQTYDVNVTARRANAGTSRQATFSFITNSNTYKQDIYANTSWGRLIVRDGGVGGFTASNTLCPFGTSTHYGACINTGEKLKFTLKNFKILEPSLDCTSVNIRDQLNLFKWNCQISGDDLIVQMVSLKEDKGLSDLVDFTNGKFKDNSVIVEKSGPVAVYKSTPDIWWTNPFNQISSSSVQVLSNASFQSVPDPIYYINANLATDGIFIRSSGVALVVKPGAKLSLNGGIPSNCDMATAGMSGADKCIVSVGYHNGTTQQPLHQVWIEGKIDAVNTHYPLLLNFARYGRFNKISVESGGIAGIYVAGSNSNRFDNFHLSMNQTGLSVNASTMNVFRNFVVDNSSVVGVYMAGASGNNIFSTGVVAASTGENFYSLTGSPVTLTNMTLAAPGAAKDNIKFTTGTSGTAFNNVVTINNSSSYNYYFAAAPTAPKMSQLFSYNKDSFAKLAFSAGGSAVTVTKAGTNWARQDPTNNLTCTNFGVSCANIVTNLEATNGIEDDFVGAVQDFKMGTDTFGFLASVLNWTDFDIPFKSFLTTVSPFGTSNPQCGFNCYAYDWTVKLNANRLFNTTGTGYDTAQNGWTEGGACPAAVQGSRTIASPSATAHLYNATEIMGDAIGDDDGMCESNEHCLFSPHFGGFQGKTDATAKYGNCTFVDGAVTGVQMFKHADLNY